MPPRSPRLEPPAWERIHRTVQRRRWTAGAREEAGEIGDYYHPHFLLVLPGSYEM